MNDNRLIESWIALQASELDRPEKDENFWAYERIDELCDDEPLECLRILVEICLKTNDDMILAHVAAGPLEDLLVRHGQLVISQLENLSKTEVKIKKAMASVWRNDIDDDVWNRLKEATDNMPSL